MHDSSPPGSRNDSFLMWEIKIEKEKIKLKFQVHDSVSSAVYIGDVGVVQIKWE